MFLLHFKRGMAEQTVTVKIPFWNESPFSRLAVPSLDRVIDLSLGRTRNTIITDDDSGGQDAVVGQSGPIDFCSTFDSQNFVARSCGYLRVQSESHKVAVLVEMPQLVQEESEKKESD